MKSTHDRNDPKQPDAEGNRDKSKIAERPSRSTKVHPQLSSNSKAEVHNSRSQVVEQDSQRCTVQVAFFPEVEEHTQKNVLGETETIRRHQCSYGCESGCDVTHEYTTYMCRRAPIRVF